MASPSKLSGETLIVHHIPLAHCQVSGSRGRCGSPLRKSANQFSCPENLGLIRTTSLPERDVLQREALVYSSLIQTSSDAFEDEGVAKRGGSVASDTSSFTSSNSEDTLPKIPSKNPGERPSSFRHNPFLLHSGEDDYDDYDEDDDEDNLNGYLEDSSFHLHGNSSEDGAELPPFHLGFDSGSFLLHKPWSSNHKGAPGRRLSSRLESLDFQRRHGSSGSTLSMDCGEHEWDDEEEDEDASVRGSESREFSRQCSEFPPGYCSDSSCNSSDGVLVNFSSIYGGKTDAEGSSASRLDVGGAEFASSGGAFYLDLHRSPTEAPQEADADPSPSSSCKCGALELDANHNRDETIATSANDLTSCGRSEARPVVATQNYYKLVTCDVSSHSSPSPGGSSVTSCSDEHSKGSPIQPTKYFLFRQEEEEEDEQVLAQLPEPADSAPSDAIEGQVYVNVSPPFAVGGASARSRLRSRSYDRNLDKTPPPRLGSLERMLSCPVRLSEGSAPSATPTPPARVTSFAEIARNKRKGGGSPAHRSNGEPLSAHSHSSGEFSPIPEDLPPLHWSGRPGDSPGGPAGGEVRTTAEGGPSGSVAAPPVVRYSRDQRPTTLPIQPFTLQQQFGKPQPKPVLPLLDEYINHMQARVGSAPFGRDEDSDNDDDAEDRRPRPSPLGSYSPPRSLSCPAPLPPTPPPTTRGHGFQRANLSTLPTLASSGHSPGAQGGAGHQEEDAKGDQECVAQRHTGHRLSPQALRWREYRRRNPLGLENTTTCSSAAAPPCRGRSARRNVFDFPPSNHVLSFHRPNGQSGRGYGDLLPDYFSQMERPPEEFCLSPDASAEESISIDLHQKRGLVKAINTAVDLIVAHFGTSRDAGVKAKLGNSSVSPNVAHLILKYLCPAVCSVLQDGLKAFTLDIIIGQRPNQPWSIVEASTQLGPSTRVLHSLYLKVSQYAELTNHSMRLNAFIFGLLNLRSLEFWFSHVYTHEDIIAAHYHPWGFLPLSQGACQPMFEELLLLLQPLSLLPFDLDPLFEPRLLQKGREHLRRKEQLCSSRQVLDRSAARSTFQLMRGPAEIKGKEAELQGGGFTLRREGTWPQIDGAEAKGHESDGAGVESERRRERVRTNGVGGEDGERDRRRERDRSRSKQQAGWWFQLMQSSQVYIDGSAEGSVFLKWEKRRKGSNTDARRRSNPPPRVGVVEGAEAHHAPDAGHVVRGKPSWMGSPPESVLSELRRTNETQPEGAGPESEAQPHPLRWSRLFGGGNVSKSDSKSDKNQKSRLPSGWLSLDRSVLDLVVQSVGKKADAQTLNTHTAEPTHEPRRHTAAPREVRALCHHITTETGHLSFHKGDVLQVLSRADYDWLLCALGDARGLVPMIYVTLKDEESEESRTH